MVTIGVCFCSFPALLTLRLLSPCEFDGDRLIPVILDLTERVRVTPFFLGHAEYSRKREDIRSSYPLQIVKTVFTRTLFGA